MFSTSQSFHFSLFHSSALRLLSRSHSVSFSTIPSNPYLFSRIASRTFVSMAPASFPPVYIVSTARTPLGQFQG